MEQRRTAGRPAQIRVGYSDLGSKVAKEKVTVYIDGKEEPTQALAIAKGGEVTVGESGNGVLTEVYYNDDAETAEIIQIKTYVGEVDKTVKATASKDAYIVIAPDSVAPAGNLTYETDEKFDDETVILYTYAKDAKEVKSVAKAEKVTGTVTRAENKTVKDKESQNVTVDGTVYKAAETFVGEEVSDVTVKEDYDLYLDSYGYMIRLDKVEDLSSDYAMVLGTESNSNNNIGNNFGSKRARLVFADGTTKVVNTAKDYNKKGDDQLPNGTIVTYKVDDDGVYTLRKVNTTQQKNTASTTFALENNKSEIVIESSTPTKVYGNSKTVYVVYNNADDEWDAYTGAKNAPTVKAANANLDNSPVDASGNKIETNDVKVYYYCKTGSMTTIMFIIPGDDDMVENSGSKTMFIAKESRSNLIHDNDGDYYEYNAIVDGEIKTIKVDGTVTNQNLNGFYSNYTVDKYGIYDNLKAKTAGSGEALFSNETGVSKTSADYTVSFKVTDAEKGTFAYTYTVDDNAAIYYVDEDGNITESSYRAISKDFNDKVFAFVKDEMIKTLVIVEVDDGGKTDVDTTAYYSIGIAGTSAGSKNVQVVLYKADKDGNRISGALTKAELKALGIKDGDITVTTAGDARNLKYGAGETGSYYVSSTATTATQWAFINSAIAYFDGYQYDGSVGGFVGKYGNTAGFMKIHLDNYLFEGKLTVSIANVGENSFHSAEVTLPLAA